MVGGAWGTLKWYPGGVLYYLGAINCFIHMIMYFYYLLTAWDSSYKTSSWKKHITQMQIVSGVFIIIYNFLIRIL